MAFSTKHALYKLIRTATWSICVFLTTAAAAQLLRASVKSAKTRNFTPAMPIVAVAVAFVVLHVAAGLDTDTDTDTDTFLVAVFEHKPIAGLVCPFVTREVALRTMHQNLDVFETQIARAADSGVQLIVFPEYALVGIHSSMHSMPQDSHKHFLPYTDDIPECVGHAECCFALHPPTLLTPPYLRVAYLARKFNMYVVVNLPDRKACDRADPLCPRDGRFQFNTNLIFNSSGCLVGKHYKHHLTSEFVFDAPVNRSLETSIIDTQFGRLGMLICMDLLTEYPTLQMLEQYKVDTLVFTTAWTDLLDQTFHSSRFHPAVASRHGVNFVSANLYMPEMPMSGSGVVSPGKAHAFESFQPEVENRLLISRLPKKPKKLETSDSDATRTASDYEHYQVDANLKYFNIYVNGTYVEQRLRSAPAEPGPYTVSDGGDVSSGYVFALHLRKPRANISLCLRLDSHGQNFCCRLNYEFFESQQISTVLNFVEMRSSHPYDVLIDYDFEIGEGITNFEGQSPTDKFIYHQYCMFCITYNSNNKQKPRQCITNREVAFFDLSIKTPADADRLEQAAKKLKYAHLSADFAKSYVYPEFQTMQRNPNSFVNASRTSHALALRLTWPNEILFKVCAENFTCIKYESEREQNASRVTFLGLVGRLYEKDEKVPLEERVQGLQMSRYSPEDTCGTDTGSDSAAAAKPVIVLLISAFIATSAARPYS